MASAQTLTEISQLYVALFGRAPDREGLAFWAAQREAGTSMSAIANTMFATAPARQYFPNGLTQSELVQAFYVNVLGRQPDLEGWNYWTGRFNATGSTGSLIQEMVGTVAGYTGTNAAGLTSAAFFNNRVAVAQYYAQKSGALAGAAEAIKNVGAATSVLLAQAAIDAGQVPGGSGAGIPVPAPTPAPAPGPAPAPAPAPGTTFVLSTGTDGIVGTANDDVFSAIFATTNPTFNTATDVLNGGAGNDTLNLTVNTAGAGTIAPTTPTVSIETVNVRNVSGNTQTITSTSYTGATLFTSDRSSAALTFNALGAGQSGAVIGDGSVAHGTVTFAYTSGTAATVSISSGTIGTGAVTVTGPAGMTTATINSTGAANSIGTLTVPTTITGLTLNATTNLTATSLVGLAPSATVTIAGAASTVNLGSLPAAVLLQVNASGLTSGGVIATLPNRDDVKFTGGAGNDVVTTGALLVTGSVDAGAGTADVLAITNAGHAATAQLAKYTGFEHVQANGITLDLEAVTGFSGWRIGPGTTSGFSNVSASQAADLRVVGNTTTLTVGVKNATLPGQQDTVKLLVSDDFAATNMISLGTLSLTGVETLEVTAVDNVTITNLVNANLSTITLKGAGNFIVTTGNTTAPNVVLNGSAATGMLTITAGTAGVQIVGGSGNDTLTGGAAVDVINGGAGDDLITGAAGADVMTGGAGTNTFAFTNASTSTPSGTNFDTITDWRTGTNKIDFGATSISVAAGGSGASGQASISAAGVATFNAADSTLALQITAVAAAIASTGGAAVAGETAIWQSGADAYIYISDGTAAVGTTDVLIKLTGVTVGAGGLTITTGDITAIAA